MRNTQPQPEPVIDPVLNDHINALPALGDALFAAHWVYQEAQSITQRQAAYTAFAQAVYELERVLAHLQGYQKLMRPGVNVSTPGKIIPLRRRQPRAGRISDASGSDALPRIRDARGRFVTGNTSSVSGPGTICDGPQKKTT